MLFIIKSPKNNQSVQILLINKTTAIIVNNIIMITACFTILLGTIYPIIIESLINQRISVGAPYFNSTVLPIMLPGLLLMSVAPVLSWQTNKLNNAPFYLYIFLAIGILMTILSILMTLNIWGIIGLFIAFYIISASIYTIISKLKKIKNTRQLKKIFIFNSSVIAHLGVGILIIGITSSSVFQKQYDKFIKINEKIQIGNYQLLLEEIEITEINNYESLTGKFSLYKNDSLIGYIYPEKRFFPVSKIITTEAGIYHSIFQDFYLVIGDNVNEGWSIKFYQNPLVLLIWVGAFIMITSILVGILKR